ncbi:inosine-5'-monophosphate dehydrogenase [Clostridium perfringens]|nr:inosine-5'-monophosphate dehydrogenase [Clostridium perfringens]
MNIAFFLTPKSEVAYEYTDATMRQVIERMEHHGYTAIPLIDKTGKICGYINRRGLTFGL